ncbi:sugar phosphate isomerase/epimerase family protein [Kineococcus sp. SYSU DK001]|uniref:sugar phosphate isomerase/epimerase family protein n=1 Tax=Kineococcus sp. SYSU DK001 TaxID=3383122 RepID=UPI003D7C5AF1
MTTHPLDADRVLCSTITFRHLPLAAALRTTTDLGFRGIDLGALPGVCDHVPYDLTREAVREVTDVVRASGVTVRSVNGDVGDLNVPLDHDGYAQRRLHTERLLDLCEGIGATALVLPNGRQDHDPVRDLAADQQLVAEELSTTAELAADRGLQLWVEAPHYFRLNFDLERSLALYDLLPATVGAVLDVSHVVASGSTPREFLRRLGHRTKHVHLRDATPARDGAPGYINHSIGNGEVDFDDAVAALAGIGYDGALALELETRDVTDDERPAAALRAGEHISSLLARHHEEISA